MMNEKALEDTLTLLFGTEMVEVVRKTYAAVDAAEARGFIAGAEANSGLSEAHRDGVYDAGYKQGYEDGVEITTGGEESFEDEDVIEYDEMLEAATSDSGDECDCYGCRIEAPRIEEQYKVRSIPLWAAVRDFARDNIPGTGDVGAEYYADDFMHDWLEGLTTADDMRA
jgi:hypothetical protein